MRQPSIDFRIVAPDDRSTRSIMLPIFTEAEHNHDLLTRHLGEAGAQMVLDLMQESHVQGDYKEFNLIRGDAEHGFDWILLMGLGKHKDATRKSYRFHDRLRSLVAIAARHFQRKRILTFAVDDMSSLGITPEIAGQLIAEGALLGTYRFDTYKTKAKYEEAHRLDAIHILHNGDGEALKASLHRGAVGSVSACWSRDLVNMPSNDLRPLDFAAQVQRLASEVDSLEAQILSKDDMERERFGLHLAVSRGSDCDPCVAILRHCPKGADAGWDVALVGKGVTFDSGGYDLKPSAYMRRMYRDMAGAAAVFGAMRTIAALNLPVNVVGIMPLAENLINGRAFRVGDILRSRKGLTVEVTNTDAEGRLLLADSLDYACTEYQPSTIIDLATLTGSVRVALGLFVTGFFTHSEDATADDAFADELMAAGRTTGEWLWRLPVDEDYRAQISSTVADIENANTDSNSGAGAITATVFLKQFIDFDVVKTWAHLDIAATSFMERTVIYNKCPYMPKVGATGIGVRLLPEFIAQSVQ